MLSKNDEKQFPHIFILLASLFVHHIWYKVIYIKMNFWLDTNKRTENVMSKLLMVTCYELYVGFLSCSNSDQMISICASEKSSCCND